MFKVGDLVRLNLPWHGRNSQVGIIMNIEKFTHLTSDKWLMRVRFFEDGKEGPAWGSYLERLND